MDDGTEFSHATLDDQVNVLNEFDRDEEDYSEDDLKRERELRALLDNELEDADLFDVESIASSSHISLEADHEPVTGGRTSTRSHYEPLLTGKAHEFMFGNQNQTEYHEDGRYEKTNSTGSDRLNDSQMERELDSLKVLYEIRGKKIAELSSEVHAAQHEKERECRQMQHHINALQGERDGLLITLEQSKEVNKSQSITITELKVKLQENSDHIHTLEGSTTDAKRQMEIAEATVSTLSEQISQLTASDALGKMRAQHESLLSSARHKQEEQVLSLKQKLDDTENSLRWKMEENNRLTDEIVKSKKAIDTEKINSFEMINKLTAQLEDSQAQCQKLLSLGVNQDQTYQLQYQLNVTSAELEKLNNTCKHLKGDLDAANGQIKTYEMLTETVNGGPAFSTPTVAGSNDKQSDDLNLPNLFNTPIPQRMKNGMAIREELIKALTINRTCRNEKIQLEEALVESSKEAKHGMQQCLRLENENAKLKESLADLQEKMSKDSFIDINQSKNKDGLEQQKAANEDLVTNDIQHLLRENVELKRNMAAMVEGHNKDKLQSLEEYQNAYIKMTDDMKVHLRQQIEQSHNEEMNKLRMDLEKAWGELEVAKNSYISLSEELHNQSDTKNDNHKIQQIQIEKKQLIERLSKSECSMNELSSKHKVEINSLETNHQSTLELTKLDCQRLLDAECQKIKMTLHDEFVKRNNDVIEQMNESCKEEVKLAKIAAEKESAREIESKVDELNNIHDKRMRSLTEKTETQMVDLEKSHRNVVKRLQDELRLIKQQSTGYLNKMGTTNTMSDDVSNAVGIGDNDDSVMQLMDDMSMLKRNAPRVTKAGSCDHEIILKQMQRHYLRSIAKVKKDVLLYVDTMKQRAAVIIRNEVLKAKQQMTTPLPAKKKETQERTMGSTAPL